MAAQSCPAPTGRSALPQLQAPPPRDAGPCLSSKPRPHGTQGPASAPSPASAPEAAESPALSAPPRSRVPPAPQLALSCHPLSETVTVSLRPFPTHLGGLCLIVLTPPASPSGAASGSSMAEQVNEITGEMTPYSTLQNSNKCRRSTYSSSSGKVECLLALAGEKVTWPI